MGSIAHITVGGYPVYGTKNYLETWYFKISDQKIFQAPGNQTNPLIYTVDPNDTELDTVYEYHATAKTLKRRLDLDGYTFEAFKKEFNEIITELGSSDYPEWMEEDVKGKYAPAFEIFRRADVNEWLKAIREVITDPRGLVSWNDVDLSNDPFIYQLLLKQPYFMDEESYALDLGIPCRSFNCAMRAVLEAMDDDTLCTIDATALVNGGWTDAFELRDSLGEKQTKFFDVFETSIASALELLNLAPTNQVLARLIYSNLITAMETYLADTAKKYIIARPPLLRRFVEKDKSFLSDKKFGLNELFTKMDTINDVAMEKLDRMVFHNIENIKSIYGDVFLVNFPDDSLRELAVAVAFRHDIVHRNGHDLKGDARDITVEEIQSLSVLVRNLVESLDTQIRDGFLEALNDSDEDED